MKNSQSHLPATKVGDAARARCFYRENGWWLFGLLLPLMVFSVRAVAHIDFQHLPYDSEHTYLPLARRLLTDFSEIWHSSDILQAAPGIMFYMALAGGDAADITALNLALAFLTIFMLFDMARRIAGNVAGAMAAWLFAVSPYMVEMSIRVMAEPPFLFLVALWLWACILCIEGQYQAWRAWAGIFLAGLALAAATLTRATWMYWLLAAPAFFALLAYLPMKTRILRLQQWRKPAWQQLIYIHLIALVFTGSYMLRNAMEFGKPVIAAGAGAVLYFGSNPMTHGQEPPFFHMGHDSLFASGWVSHLTLEGDARLKTVALSVLANMPRTALFKLYTRKAVNFLFFSKSHLRQASGRRLWRIALVFLAVLGAWHARKHPATVLIGAATMYQWIVHIPVLYNPRYSFSALDIQLTLLAAIGIALLWQARHKKRFVFCNISAILLCMAAGAWHQKYSNPVMPDMESVPHRMMNAALPQTIQFAGLDGNPFFALSASSGEMHACLAAIHQSGRKNARRLDELAHIGYCCGFDVGHYFSENAWAGEKFALEISMHARYAHPVLPLGAVRDWFGCALF